MIFDACLKCQGPACPKDRLDESLFKSLLVPLFYPCLQSNCVHLVRGMPGESRIWRCTNSIIRSGAAPPYYNNIPSLYKCDLDMLCAYFASHTNRQRFVQTELNAQNLLVVGYFKKIYHMQYLLRHLVPVHKC